jgi:hypothetical protein
MWRAANDAAIAHPSAEAIAVVQRLFLWRARRPCCWYRPVARLISRAELPVGVAQLLQVVGLARADVFVAIVVLVDVRVLGRRVEWRGLVGIAAAFAKARRVLYGAKGAVDGLELLLARLHVMLAVR